MKTMPLPQRDPARGCSGVHPRPFKASGCHACRTECAAKSHANSRMATCLAGLQQHGEVASVNDLQAQRSRVFHEIPGVWR